MAKLHVVGIGGTGHKIVSAVVHLAASGAFKGQLGPNTIGSIRILTIDADDSNGNLAQTQTVLGAYRKFYKALTADTKLGLIDIELVTDKINLSLYKDDKKSINQSFNIPQFKGSDDDKFVRFLYTDSEIDAEFEQGFCGHTSIGTLVVKGILSSDSTWNAFTDGINPDDFVVIMGSVFGGTGASAIPVVLDHLKEMQGSVKFNLAAVMLLPYFTAIGAIQESGILQPKSEAFSTKAKASLYYYNVQKQYEKTDALYIMGEPVSNFSTEAASRGSKKQQNKAHPIELFAATAVIDFIKENNDRKGGKIITADRETDGNEYYYTWKMLQNADPRIPDNIQRLMKMAVFYNKILYHEIKTPNNAPGAWLGKYDSDLRTIRNTDNNFEYENVREYLSLFIDWIYDIHKKNLDEINSNTNRPQWTGNSGVKLFNAGYPQLFDSGYAADSNIVKFEELVYNDAKPKISAKIYDVLCKKTPAAVGAGGKRFAALFAVLCDIIEKDDWFKPKVKLVTDNLSSVPYLAEKNNIGFVRSQAAPGKLWSAAEPTLLINIADALPNVQTDQFSAADLSIPSPWSIFILFELTLTLKEFASLNETAYNQWCGLLTLLVLRDLNRYTQAGLKLETLKMGAKNEFLDTVIDTLKPDTYVFDNPDWSVPYCLSLNGETIAFLANNTIVCPAYEYSAAVKTALHIMAPTIVDDSGRFLRPDNYFKDQSQSANRDSKFALSLFLNALKKAITKQAANNPRSIIKDLQNLIDRYIKDIGNVTPNIDISIDEEEPVCCYDLFTKIKINSKNKPELPFLIKDAKEKVALIGLDICGTSCSSPQSATIFVTDNLLYNMITPEFINENSGKKIDGITLIWDKELLLDSMIIVDKKEGAVFHSLTNQKSAISNYEIIWPVNEKLLGWFDTAKLNNMLSARHDETAGKIYVTLNIPLTGNHGKHSITKEYQIKKAEPDGTQNVQNVCRIIEKRLLPLWSVWPYSEVLDMNGKNAWERYNFFCVEHIFRGINVFGMEPVFHNGVSAPNVMDGENMLSTISTVQKDAYYRRFRELPIALKVQEKTEHDTVYSGAVLLEEPKKIRASAVEWRIGLDFGTTTTTAYFVPSADGAVPSFINLLSEYYWKEGRNTPEIEVYENDIVYICKNFNQDEENAADYHFIDPMHLKQNGYSTSMEKMDAVKAGPGLTIFKSERIFWHNYENLRKLNADTSGRRDNLITNIKWENNPSNPGKYLNQLMTQIVYAAAKNGIRKIKWFFSFPTAFSMAAKGNFQDCLEKIIKNLKDSTGVDIEFHPHHLITESIAAAYYFRNKHPKMGTFLCVDIGGSSSDISLWVKEQHIFQTSIRFASRNMFVMPLAGLLKRESVMKAVRTPNVADGIHTMLDYKKKDPGDKIKFMIETVLFEYYDTFKLRLDALAGADEKAYLNFKHSVFIAYSGLVYYLANITAALFNDGNRKVDREIARIVFGLSGKGAKLILWIHAFCGVIYEAAEKLIEEKTGIKIKFIEEFSADTAKTETAYGMICDLDGAGELKNPVELRDPEIFLGADINVSKDGKNEYYKRDRFIDPYDDIFGEPSKLQVEFDKEIQCFDEFLAFINGIAIKTKGDIKKISIDWYEKEKKNLWAQAKIVFGKTLTEAGRFEVPFIVLLEIFMDLYADSQEKA